MNQFLFKKKFKIIKDYEYKMPGISTGLQILKSLNLEKNDIKEDLLFGVEFYNFMEDEVFLYSFKELNIKIYGIYTDIVINNQKLLYNKLYWIFCDVYSKLYSKHNYPYNKNLFTMHDILNKFIHGLRIFPVNNNPLKFYIHEIMKIYTTQYFNENITADQFYMFMVDFILDLCEFNILSYDKSENSIVFNSIYYEDLISLKNFSFNLMLLGNNNIYNYYDLSQDKIDVNLSNLYQIYTKSDTETKLFINDLLISLVISSSVKEICAEENINNIFIESIKYGLSKK